MGAWQQGEWAGVLFDIFDQVGAADPGVGQRIGQIRHPYEIIVPRDVGPGVGRSAVPFTAGGEGDVTTNQLTGNWEHHRLHHQIGQARVTFDQSIYFNMT